MSTVNEQISALTGATDGNQSAKDVDWKQKCDELEKELNSSRVEQGRVRKLNGELEAAKKEIEELRSQKTNLKDSLPEELRESVAPEVQDATEMMVRTALAKQQAETDRRIADMEERYRKDAEAYRARSSEEFLSRVDNDFPGFRSSVTAGGDKAEAWTAYRRYNQASISEAFNSGDYETFAYHVRKFYSDHLGVDVPSAKGGVATPPDPLNHGGGSNGGTTVSGKTYTQEEFMALYDAVERARDKGDYAEMARLNAEIKAAPAEGRVK